MDNDMSWTGLAKKGFKLEGYVNNKWIPLDANFDLHYAIAYEIKIRYKHSIQ